MQDEADPPAPRATVPPLERPVQEHLGKQLRSSYGAMTEKPAFLGDPAVPPQFEGLVQKIAAQERHRSEQIHERGVAAVGEALGAALEAAPPDPDKAA